MPRSEKSTAEMAVAIDELCDALVWISEYPNRVLPHEGQEEHAVELADEARKALALQAIKETERLFRARA